MSDEPQSQLLLYQTEDGQTRLEVPMEDETVWLSLNQMAELFQTGSSPVISKHIKNIFEEGELSRRQLLQNLQQFKPKATNGHRDSSSTTSMSSFPSATG